MSTRTLVGYCIRRGREPHEGDKRPEWLSGSRLWTTSVGMAFRTISRETAEDHMSVLPGRVVAIYRVSRRDIEDETAGRIAAWLRKSERGWSARELAQSIERDEWRTK